MEQTIIVLIGLLIWTYIGYPIILALLGKFSSTHDNSKAPIAAPIEDLPSVSIVVVAHNEEKVIRATLDSLLLLEYPTEKLEIVVASDHSTDRTNIIANEYGNLGIRLVETRERKGKANAHNEACETIKSDVIAFCDANTLWEPKTLLRLVNALGSQTVGYVSGQLCYTNTSSNSVSGAEGAYWSYELMLRELESKTCGITAGNGAAYAIKRSCYRPINPLYNHDLVFPSMVRSQGMKPIYESYAIAYEKAGETTEDEFNRKVRMFGRAWHFILRNPHVFNPFNVGALYAVAMISHRFLRYCAGLIQFAIAGVTGVSIFLQPSDFVIFVFYLQLIFYFLVLVGSTGWVGRLLYTLYYFNLFHVATVVGFYRAITNQVRPFWISPQSTRI